MRLNARSEVSFGVVTASLFLFVNDQGGNENFNLYAVNPNEQPPSGAEVPVARNLTNSEKVRTVGYNVPRTEPDAVYVGHK